MRAPSDPILTPDPRHEAPLRAIGQEVVRIGLCADLSKDDVERLVQALDRCREKVRFC